MVSLIKDIENIIDNYVFDFIQKVEDVYDINSSDLKKIWSDYKLKVKKDTPSPITEQAQEKQEIKTGKCMYKFIKGKNIGTICNKNTSDNESYCSLHKKFEASGQKEKKVIPKVQESLSPDRVLKMNKEINKWWHPVSKLVFKSRIDKVVIGTYKDDIFELLTEDSKEDIENCKKYGYRYELSKKSEEEISDEELEKMFEKMQLEEEEKENKEEIKKVEKKKEEIKKKEEKEIKKVEKKKEEIKKVENKKSESPKKSITDEINTYAKDVEDVLSEIFDKSNNCSDNEEEEEEIEDDFLDEEF